MISVAEAEALILSHCHAAKAVAKPVGEVFCDIVLDEVLADRPLPPFNRVAMDGVAIRSIDFAEGLRRFAVDRVVAAGMDPGELRGHGVCIEVMTGAMLPTGADAVVPVEEYDVVEGYVQLKPLAKVSLWQHIHRVGSDCERGQTLLTPGQILGCAEVGIAASVGCEFLRVAQKPHVTIISTGDELIDVGQTPLPYQIRRSNSHALSQGLRDNGFLNITSFHIGDNYQDLKAGIAEVLEGAEVVVLSGGVSKGRFDYVPKVLGELGVREVFHSVSQRPGKPMWFGVGERKQLVFGLPGNPVSCLIGLHRYVLPALQFSLGQNLHGPRPLFARLEEDFNFHKALTYFLPVILTSGRDGGLYAQPRPVNGSGDFSSLSGTHGFVELDAQIDKFSAGDVVPLWMWRGISSC